MINLVIKRRVMRVVDEFRIPIPLDEGLSVCLGLIKIGSPRISHPRIYLHKHVLALKDLAPFALLNADDREVVVASIFSRKVIARVRVEDDVKGVLRVDNRSCCVTHRSGRTTIIRYSRGGFEVESVDTVFDLLTPSENSLIALNLRRKIIAILENSLDLASFEPRSNGVIHCAEIRIVKAYPLNVLMCYREEGGIFVVLFNNVFGIPINIGKRCCSTELSNVETFTSLESVAVKLGNEVVVKKVGDDDLNRIEIPKNFTVINVQNDVIALKRGSEIVVKSLNEDLILSRFHTNVDIGKLLIPSTREYLLATTKGSLLFIPMHDPELALRIPLRAPIRSIALLGKSFVICSDKCVHYRVEYRGNSFFLEEESLPPTLRSCIEVSSGRLLCLSRRSLMILEDDEGHLVVVPSYSAKHIILKVNHPSIVAKIPAKLHSDTHILNIARHARRERLASMLVSELSDSSKTSRNVVTCLRRIALRGYKLVVSVEEPKIEEPACVSLNPRSIDLSKFVERHDSAICIDVDSLSSNLRRLSIQLTGLYRASIERGSIDRISRCIDIGDDDYIIISMNFEDHRPRTFNVLLPTCPDVEDGVEIAQSQSFALIRRGCRDVLTVNDKCFSIHASNLTVGNYLEPQLGVEIVNSCNVPITVISGRNIVLVREGERKHMFVKLRWSPRNIVSIVASYPGGIKKLVYTITIADLIRLAHVIALKTLASLGNTWNTSSD